MSHVTCQPALLEATLPSEQIEFSAKVPSEDYEEFKHNFPQYGAVSWFINSALREFNRLNRENPTARELVNESIQNLLVENRQSSGT